jgi:hypothetical protein
MKIRKMLTTAAVALTAVGMSLTLAACGGQAGAADAPAATPTADAAVVAEVEIPENDVEDYLIEIHGIVAENLTWGDVVWEDIMIADDVPSPEPKYGLLVVPFFPDTNVVCRVTRTVNIRDHANWRVEIDSCETGATWSVNQDGDISFVR